VVLILGARNNLAGLLATEYDAHNLASLPALFLKIFAYGIGGGAIMLLLAPWLKRLMAGRQVSRYRSLTRRSAS